MYTRNNVVEVVTLISNLPRAAGSNVKRTAGNSSDWSAQPTVQCPDIVPQISNVLPSQSPAKELFSLSNVILSTLK